MNNHSISLRSLTLKTVVVHTITYFVVGLIAFTVFNYSTEFTRPEVAGYLRPTDEPIVALGPALQFIRGILFALAFYQLCERLFKTKDGWLVLWLVLVVVGIFSTFGPSPGSVEGLIYTTLPVRQQLTGGMLEVLAQSFLLSALLCYWVNNSEKRWLTWVLGIFYALVVLMSVAGYFAA